MIIKPMMVIIIVIIIIIIQLVARQLLIKSPFQQIWKQHYVVEHWQRGYRPERPAGLVRWQQSNIIRLSTGHCHCSLTCTVWRSLTPAILHVEQESKIPNTSCRTALAMHLKEYACGHLGLTWGTSYRDQLSSYRRKPSSSRTSTSQSQPWPKNI